MIHVHHSALDIEEQWYKVARFQFINGNGDAMVHGGVFITTAYIHFAATKVPSGTNTTLRRFGGTSTMTPSRFSRSH